MAVGRSPRRGVWWSVRINREPLLPPPRDLKKQSGLEIAGSGHNDSSLADLSLLLLAIQNSISEPGAKVLS